MRDIISPIVNSHYHTQGHVYKKKTWMERIMPFFEKHEIRFILIFSGFFLATIMLLAGLGLVPSEFQENTNQGVIDQLKNAAIAPLEGDNGSQGSNGGDLTTQNNGNQVKNSGTNGTVPSNTNYEYPIRIVIPAVGVDGVVKNPSSNNIDALDNALTLGAVRYPKSGLPGIGNMFIFGHSTGFKIVQNKAYKVFNTIKNVNQGDEIQVYGDKNVYVYKVLSVKEVNKDETLVSFDTKGPAMLTLSTCDSFGTKTDRFVVQAVFDRVGSL